MTTTTTPSGPPPAASRARSADGLPWRGLVLAVLLSSALAPNAGAANAKPPEVGAQTYTFAFHDADIAQVAEAILGNALGLTYTIDPAVTGKMSFRIERRLTNGQLLSAFEAALKTNDVAMVRQGDSLLLEPRAKAKGSSSFDTLGASGVHGVGYETLAVPLNYATPSEVAKALQAIAPADSVVFVDDKQGLLILGGDPADLEAAVQMVRTFDHSGFEEAKIRFFELSEAPADTVADDLGKVLQAAGINGVTVIPLKRLNGLFVFAKTNKALDEVADWVGKLDVAPKETSTTFFAYHPHNVSAEELAAALTGLLTGRQPARAPEVSGQRVANFSAAAMMGGGQGYGGQTGGLAGSYGGGFNGGFGGGGFGGGANAFGVGGGPSPQQAAVQAPAGAPGLISAASPDEAGANAVHVGFDRGSNTVLVMAPPGRWVQLQKILQEIDHSPAQVLIEASILEVTLNNQNSFGVDWSVVGATGQPAAQSINNSSGTVGSTTPGLSVTFLGKSLQAAVHALQTTMAVEVVSSPKILALDNHQAQLQVGDEVPVITATGQSTLAAGSPVVNSVAYLDTGVILNVTPRISGDRIYLDIDQEVSDSTANGTSGIDSPTIQQRRLQTTLILDNGDLVALGGMISDSRSKSDSGAPWLKDIPVLGNLFKTVGKTLTRTELVVLITAKVVPDKAAADRVMADLMGDMKEIQRRGLIKR